MLDFNAILRRLSGLNREDLRHIADSSGVPFDTLLKIANGETKNPRVLTVEPLVAYFERETA
jgi:hypothetical protein